MKYFFLLVALLSYPVMSAAENNDPHDADRKALRTILMDFETGLNEKNLDKLLVHLDDQAVMTFMTTEMHGKSHLSIFLLILLIMSCLINCSRKYGSTR